MHGCGSSPTFGRGGESPAGGGTDRSGSVLSPGIGMRSPGGGLKEGAIIYYLRSH